MVYCLTQARRDYSEALRRRMAVVSENRSRNMRRGHLPPLPVPPKPEPLMVWLITNSQGDYGGILYDVRPVESERDEAEQYTSREYPIARLIREDDKYFRS